MTTTTLTRTQRTLCHVLDQHVATCRRQRVATRKVAGCALSDAALADRLGIAPRTARQYRSALRSSGALHSVRVRCHDGVALLDATTATPSTITPTDVPDILRLGDVVYRLTPDRSGIPFTLVPGGTVFVVPVGHVSSVEGQAALRGQADKILSSTASEPITYPVGSTRPRGRSAVRKSFPPGWVQ